MKVLKAIILMITTMTAAAVAVYALLEKREACIDAVFDVKDKLCAAIAPICDGLRGFVDGVFTESDFIDDDFVDGAEGSDEI